MSKASDNLLVACSHQDQVIAPPSEAQVILSSSFTPNAGLYYASGRALSFQPHPEFLDDYAQALVDLRKGRAPDDVIATATASFEQPSDSRRLPSILRVFYLHPRNVIED